MRLLEYAIIYKYQPYLVIFYPVYIFLFPNDSRFSGVTVLGWRTSGKLQLNFVNDIGKSLVYLELWKQWGGEELLARLEKCYLICRDCFVWKMMFKSAV